MIHYCPSCWAEIPDVSKCPSCGADVQALALEHYEEKLIRALRHPEPSTPVRAATILGELSSKAAVEPLIELVSSSHDPYIQEAGIVALSRIGDRRALNHLTHWTVEGALRVRLAAKQALKGLTDQ